MCYLIPVLFIHSVSCFCPESQVKLKQKQNPITASVPRPHGTARLGAKASEPCQLSVLQAQVRQPLPSSAQPSTLHPWLRLEEASFRDLPCPS